MIRASRAHPRLAALAVAIVTIASPGSAAADSPSTTVAAQALFDDAKASMDRGDFASACPKLEESQRLQPAGGTLLFLGVCFEGLGKSASAWARFNEALSSARRDARTDRERVAEQHIATLAAKLTRLDVVVPEGVRALSGLRVSRDGEDVPAPLWGTPIPVDPGSHTVRVTAPRMKPWETVVATAGEAATATVTVPALELDPDAPAPEATKPPPTPMTTPAVQVEPPSGGEAERAPGGGQRTIALIVGGVGVVGLGIGTYFGITALSKKNSEAANGCPTDGSGACTSPGVAVSQDAFHDGNIATVALGVGAAAVIGGAALWLTAPSAPASVRVVPTVGRGSAGLGLTGAW
jgi:serine/threonine-protein kinase